MRREKIFELRNVIGRKFNLRPCCICIIIMVATNKMWRLKFNHARHLTTTATTAATATKSKLLKPVPFRADRIRPASPNEIALFGVCYDKQSSFLRGAAGAPAAIRAAFRSASANTFAESGRDISPALYDVGDLTLVDDLNAEVAMATIESAASALVHKRHRLLSLGGDHAISFPLISAVAQKFPQRLTVVQIDAHPDLYDQFDNNRFSHASPFARLLEGYPYIRLIQLGIRCMTSEARAQAKRFGVQVVEMDAVASFVNCKHLTDLGPTYVTFDMDAIDPAFAPGVSHHEPGGLTVREAIQIIKSIDGNIVGADIVEYNPTRDLQGVTGMVGAKILRELADRMLVSAQNDPFPPISPLRSLQQ